MLDKLLEWDRELFLFLNSKHIDWLDPIMLFFSSYTGWILVFLLMSAFIYFKAEIWKKTGVFFFSLSTGLSALFTNIIKLIIERPRPIHNETWQDTIHAIEKFSDSFSFFSSHSATTFTMAVFFLLFFRKKKIYGVIALVWATIVAYSRIYVAKHYPFDVLVGILFGIMIGILGYKLFQNFKEKKELLKP
ncbi:phosphatase PAP2 family protein [Dysgonomonas sp. Marseille-P4677]|uniref:phosphatase PAP2 family protein n=1 Tax=Dysgonomonas sp. Marseille-P4677 TaxID=2364790 RepID=UPI001912D747|nr:phosphatase PAP2 family protein [Dysgonomonas sp. Marseille-P4677]MBK5719432.1 phosphatase PAP2 family protein [Dysgonomonas sp. Marseille-P4677]